MNDEKLEQALQLQDVVQAGFEFSDEGLDPKMPAIKALAIALRAATYANGDSDVVAALQLILKKPESIPEMGKKRYENSKAALEEKKNELAAMARQEIQTILESSDPYVSPHHPALAELKQVFTDEELAKIIIDKVKGHLKETLEIPFKVEGEDLIPKACNTLFEQIGTKFNPIILSSSEDKVEILFVRSDGKPVTRMTYTKNSDEANWSVVMISTKKDTRKFSIPKLSEANRRKFSILSQLGSVLHDDIIKYEFKSFWNMTKSLFLPRLRTGRIGIPSVNILDLIEHLKRPSRKSPFGKDPKKYTVDTIVFSSKETTLGTTVKIETEGEVYTININSDNFPTSLKTQNKEGKTQELSRYQDIIEILKNRLYPKLAEAVENQHKGWPKNVIAEEPTSPE